MNYKTYTEWFNEIVWLKNKIILPNGYRIDKGEWITNKGFDIDKFNKYLFDTYNLYLTKEKNEKSKI